MSVPGLDSFSTIDALAAQLGVSSDKAQRIVEAAGVRVVEGCFSVPRLHEALAGPGRDPLVQTPLAGSRATSDDELRDALARLLGEHGVVILHSIRRRTLEVTLAADESIGRVLYSQYATPPVHLGSDADDPDDLDPSLQDELDYEAIEISRDHPRTARVFFAQKERNGTLDFTVGSVTSPSTDFAIFLGHRLDRAWMIRTDHLLCIYNDLVAQKTNPDRRGRPPRGIHLHAKPNALRVLLSRLPSNYELHRRLYQGGEPSR